VRERAPLRRASRVLLTLQELALFKALCGANLVTLFPKFWGMQDALRRASRVLLTLQELALWRLGAGLRVEG